MKSEAIKTVKYQNFTINIYPDDSCENPIKEWDVLGEFCCWHRRYDLGNNSDFANPEEVRKYAQKTNSMLYPLFMYDHGGLALSLTPFSCPWDSGQLGYILVPRDNILENYGVKKITQELKQKIHKIIEGEVETYNQYLRGDVYGYVVTDNQGNEIDSCWGYYGVDICLKEAKSIVDWESKQTIKMHCKQVKQWIKNKVPFIYRQRLRVC